MKAELNQPLMSRVDAVGQWIAPLALRSLLAWEFFEAGREKLHGENWFADLDGRFPLPFSLLGANVNWTLATWFELAGGIALLLGLGTRYAAFSLWVLTIVAIYAVHWPSEWSSVAELWQGYAITNDGFGNYKLPLIYLVMLLPLILGGGGRFSLDHLVRTFASPEVVTPGRTGPMTWGLVLAALALPLTVLLPWVGGALTVLGVALVASAMRRTAPRSFARPATVLR